MLLAGVDKVFRDAIVGHSLKGMDAHYIVLTDDSLANAMDRYTKWLDQDLLKLNHRPARIRRDLESPIPNDHPDPHRDTIRGITGSGAVVIG